jgi:hypothetical protein
MDSSLLSDYRRWYTHRYPQTIYSETRINKIINAIHLHPNALALWMDNSAYIKEGLKDTFECSPFLCQHMTLIDEIATTGGALKSIARLLQQQGVTTIDA